MTDELPAAFVRRRARNAVGATVMLAIASMLYITIAGADLSLLWPLGIFGLVATDLGLLWLRVRRGSFGDNRTEVEEFLRDV